MTKKSTPFLLTLSFVFCFSALFSQRGGDSSGGRDDSGTSPTNQNSACPVTVDPVCGSNGVTYLNSCFAELDGVTEYTKGVCFSDCIDPLLIDPSAPCDQEYDPVCGCNEYTYFNACHAETSGVTTYTKGPCETGQICYDPVYLVTNKNITVDYASGIITQSCTEEYEPVCGCDGVTYPNSCFAESSGITSYTKGKCAPECIDPELIDPDVFCTQEYDPVCGCNGVTYTNPCEAKKAGVVSYVPGVCGALSTWCSKSTPIQCGDFLAAETTEGGTNHIRQYPGCSNGEFLAPEKVYIINKNTAGDLQIGLEIITPGVDLDLFLLADDCGKVTCLRSSKNNNQTSNNEGIILEDAPIGTYYIVVDGQFKHSVGEYRLEVSCGYLYCADATPLDCGVPYRGNNIDGHDNISLYTCDNNILNVENNGPEVVHTFSVIQSGPVNIRLTGLSANLELFLLHSCDRGACLDFSQKPGTQDEGISTFLDPGQYYIVVDGYNGATSDYTLTVDCEATAICELEMAELSSQPATCGAHDGSFTVTSSGGKPGFLVSWRGPSSGSFSTFSNKCTIYNLPAGEYEVTKTDKNGCSVTETVEIESQGNLALTAIPVDALCGSNGSVQIAMNNGKAPYKFSISGPASKNFLINFSFFNIKDLPAGDYELYVVDKLGCTATKTFSIEEETGNFHFSSSPQEARCEELGSIAVKTYQGTAPYKIKLSGPVSGNASVGKSSFNIINLPGGTYNLEIEDEYGCSFAEVVTVEDSDIEVSALSTGGICGDMGTILITLVNGVPMYKIAWEGPTSGETTTANSEYLIKGLADGKYEITVTDQTQCIDYQIVQMVNSGDGLSANLIGVDGVCGENGSIWIDINNGSPGFEVSWSGPESGSFTTDDNGFDIEDLPPGDYVVTIVDESGCEFSETVEVATGSDLDVYVAAQNGLCGELGAIAIDIDNGTAEYVISWEGPQSGSFGSNESATVIPDLVSGLYIITVKDAFGCLAERDIYLDNSEASLEIYVEPINSVCGDYGMIDLEIDGGTPNYTVIWSGPVSGSKVINTFAHTIADLPSGKYDVVVKDALDCENILTVEIENENSISIDVTAVNGICDEMGSALITIDGNSGSYQVSWDGPAAGSIEIDDNFTTISDLPSGQYNFTVSNGDNCSQTEEVSILNFSGLQSISLDAVDAGCDPKGAIVVDISGGSPGYVVSWDGPVSGSYTTDAERSEIDELPGGNYTVTVKDDNGCEIAGSATIVTEFTTSLVGENADCGGTGTISVWINGGKAPYEVAWEGPDSGKGQGSEQHFPIEGLSAGNYEVEITDADGCVTSNVIRVYANDNVSLSATPSHQICDDNGAVALTFTGGTPKYQLKWSGPKSGSVELSDDYYAVDDLPAGTYTFVVEDKLGCTDTREVKVKDNSSDLAFQAAVIVNDCGQYNTVWIDIIDGYGPYVITWTGPQSGSYTSGELGHELEGLVPGYYTVTIQDDYGCVVEDDITVTETNINLVDLTSYAGECGENGSIKVSLLGDADTYEITWSGPQSGSTTTRSNEYTIENLPAGQYEVKISDENLCTDTETALIEVTEPEIDFQTAVIVNDCGQYNTIWIDILDGTGPYTIIWSGPMSGSIVTGSLGHEVEDLDPGKYTITIKNESGCQLDQEVMITETFANFASLSAEDGLCGETGRITIDIDGGSPGYDISWSGPASGSASTDEGTYTIEDLPSGTYDIKLVDANGCTDQQSVNVKSAVYDLDFSVSTIVNHCGQYNNIWMDINAGLGPFVITWTGPESGSITTGELGHELENLPVGEYTIRVRDVNGCEENKVVNVLHTDLNLINLTSSPAQGSERGKIVVEILGGTPDYNLNWSGTGNGNTSTDQTSYTIEDLEEGVYTVTLIDAAGCEDSESINVTEQSCALSATFTAIDETCEEKGGILVNISGGNGPFEVSWSGTESGNTTRNGRIFEIQNLPGGAFEVSIEDGTGCLIGKSLNISETGEEPQAGFSFQVDNFTLDFDNTSTEGEYLWKFGDGSTSSERNPTYTYDANGNFNACLTVTNECGSNTHCTSISLAPPSSAVVVLDVGETTGKTGSMVKVPVTAQNLEYVVSLAGTLEAEKEEVAGIVGVSPGAVDPQYNPGNASFNFFDNAGRGHYVAEGEILFYVNVELRGESGESSLIRIAESPLEVEVGTVDDDGLPIIRDHMLLKGKVTIANTSNVLGNIHTYWGDGILGARVDLMQNNDLLIEEYTDEEGSYMLPNLAVGDTFMIKPVLDSVPENGLSTFGLFIGQRYILGKETPQITSPYQVIAGDANCNGAFTTLDLFIIQKLIIGTSERFPNCPSWVFVSDQSEMPDPFNIFNVFPYLDYRITTPEAVESANFIGVKVGDILGDAVSTFLSNGEIEGRSTGKLPLVLHNRSIKKGETVDLYFRSADFQNIASYQLGLQFDRDLLTFQELVDIPGNEIQHVSLNDRFAEEEGRLLMNWFHAAGEGLSIDDDEIVFSVRFKARRAVPDLNGIFSISDRRIKSGAHRTTGEALDIEVVVLDETNTQGSTPGFKLYQNRPNPFKDKTIIGFDLPEQRNVTITIHDRVGKIVKQINGTFDMGFNTVEMNKSDLNSGIYFYTIETDSFTDTKSLVIFE